MGLTTSLNCYLYLHSHDGGGSSAGRNHYDVGTMNLRDHHLILLLLTRLLDHHKNDVGAMNLRDHHLVLLLLRRLLGHQNLCGRGGGARAILKK